MNNVVQLEQQLEHAVMRAENAARIANGSLETIKKAEKRILKAKLRIKTAEKIILDQQRLSEEKTNNILDEVINIATRATKKQKALKKLSKIKKYKSKTKSR